MSTERILLVLGCWLIAYTIAWRSFGFRPATAFMLAIIPMVGTIYFQLPPLPQALIIGCAIVFLFLTIGGVNILTFIIWLGPPLAIMLFLSAYLFEFFDYNLGRVRGQRITAFGFLAASIEAFLIRWGYHFIAARKSINRRLNQN